MRTRVVVLVAGLLGLASPAAFADGSGGEVSEDLIREMAEHARRFEKVLGEYRGDMNRVVEVKYQEKRDYVDASFKETVA